MPYPPLSLLKRLVLGIPLTPAQEDQNKTDIETAVNAQAAQLAAALNPNGTLKPGSVNTAAIQDRAVTLAKLAFLSNFYAVDTGAVNAMAISFAPLPLTAYSAGLQFVVKAAATNTGATTLNADGIAARPVKKVTGAGLVDLSAGDIQAAGIFIVEDDGTQFILLNPTPPSNLLTGPQFLAAGPAIIYASGPAVGWTTVAAGVLAGLGVPSNAKAVILQATLRWASATDGQAFANIRKDNVSFPLLLTRVGGTDAVATGSQAVFPITNTLQFDYQITESVPGVADGEIKLVGYYL